MNTSAIAFVSIFLIIVGLVGMLKPIWFVAMNESSKRYRVFSGSNVSLTDEEIKKLSSLMEILGVIFFAFGVGGLGFLYIN